MAYCADALMVKTGSTLVGDEKTFPRSSGMAQHAGGIQGGIALATGAGWLACPCDTHGTSNPMHMTNAENLSRMNAPIDSLLA